MAAAHIELLPHAGATLMGATTKSSSGSSTLILFVLLFGAMYFLWLRPQRRKLQQRQQSQIRSIDIGDEVVTQSGIIGTVVSMDEDRAVIKVNDQTTITVVRAAIGRRIEPVVPEVPESDEVAGSEGDDLSSFDEEPPTRRGGLFRRRNQGEDV